MENPTAPYRVHPEHAKELDNQFSYHKPFGSQAARYELIRTKAKELAIVLLENVPQCADRTAAVRKLREAVMTANAAIAINEVEPTPEVAQPAETAA